MAWRSHGKTHLELVDHLYKNKIIKSDVVYKAMIGVDRGDFCSSTPYLDNPQPIGKHFRTGRKTNLSVCCALFLGDGVCHSAL